MYVTHHKLVISEKPSVAQSIAKVLGAATRREGFLEGNGYLVSWCFGHLIELAEPEAYDTKYSKWRQEDLPIFPQNWQYFVSGSTRKQYSILDTLMHREDVVSVINACDAGREGELIFRLVYNQSQCTKPMERLWISSMEDSAIREGFQALKPGSEYDNLYEAALCRERADWLVGINATRLFSCLYNKTLNVGRVMTPTLAMIVLRDAQAKAFKPEPYYTVQLSAGNMTVSSKRMHEKVEAIALQEKCRNAGKLEIQSVVRTEKAEHPPLLYDLTALQRDANRILDFTAQQTLDYTQSLYERKLVTYPRTDSHYLTDDMGNMIPELRKTVEDCFTHPVHSEMQFSRLLNSSKVTDHHAIIPTKELAHADLAALPSGEHAILQLIAVRFLCALADDYCYSETEAHVFCAGEEFSCKSKEVLSAGWHSIRDYFYPPAKKDTEKAVSISEAAMLPLTGSDILSGKTQAPKRYTEDSLLSAMQNAAKEDIPAEAERQGIGTPATRAGIIEKLIQKGYVERSGGKKGKSLIATAKGNALITIMPEQIQSASMTADWEQRLLEIERGEYSPAVFIGSICAMIQDLINTSKIVEGAEIIMAERKIIGTCPCCGAEVVERQKGWFCANRSCRFILWKDNAFFQKIGKRLSTSTVEHLLLDGHVRLKDCKNKATGKVYNATLHMVTEADGRPVFNLSFENGGNKHDGPNE